MSRENPYHTIGREFEANVIASGEAGVGGGRGIEIAERLREYAFFRQETAGETGDALLVSDLLDAARALRQADQPDNETAPLTLTIRGDGAVVDVTFAARRHDITTIAAFVETGTAVITKYVVDTRNSPAIATAMTQFARELYACRTAGLYAKKKEEDLLRGAAG